MAKSERKQQAGATGKKRRKIRDDFFEEDDEEIEFMGSEDEGRAGEDENEEDADIEETAEQKRLRIGTLSSSFINNCQYTLHTERKPYTHHTCTRTFPFISRSRTNIPSTMQPRPTWTSSNTPNKDKKKKTKMPSPTVSNKTPWMPWVTIVAK